MTAVTSKLTTWACWILLSSICIYFYQLNIQIPLYADDYCRAYHTLDFSHAWRSAQNIYFSWSGRFPVMFLNHVLYSTSDFSIRLLAGLNTAALVCCIFLIRQIMHAPTTLLLLIASIVFFFLFWFSLDYFGEVVLWKTGQVQYFWGGIIATICILPSIQTIIWGKSSTPPPIQIIFFSGLCLIGGMWLENLSVAVTAVWAGLLIYGKWFQRRQIPSWIWVAFTCWLIGCLILIGAPGNFKRAEVLGESMGFLEKIPEIFMQLIEQVDARLWGLYLVFLPLCRINNKSNFYLAVQQSIVFLVLASAAALAMAAAPHNLFDGRAAFPSEFFLILAVLSVFPTRLLTRHSDNRIPRTIQSTISICLLLLLMPLSLDAKNTYQLYQNVAQQNHDRLAVIAKQIEAGKTDVLITPLYFSAHKNTLYSPTLNKWRWFARDVTRDPEHWTNNCFERFYNLSSVTMVQFIEE